MSPEYSVTYVSGRTKGPNGTLFIWLFWESSRTSQVRQLRSSADARRAPRSGEAFGSAKYRINPPELDIPSEAAMPMGPFLTGSSGSQAEPPRFESRLAVQTAASCPTGARDLAKPNTESQLRSSADARRAPLSGADSRRLLVCCCVSCGLGFRSLQGLVKPQRSRIQMIPQLYKTQSNFFCIDQYLMSGFDDKAVHKIQADKNQDT